MITYSKLTLLSKNDIFSYKTSKLASFFKTIKYQFEMKNLSRFREKKENTLFRDRGNTTKCKHGDSVDTLHVIND